MNLALFLTCIFIIVFVIGIKLINKVFVLHVTNGTTIGFIFWLIFCIYTPVIIWSTYAEKIEYYKEERDWYIYSLGNDKYVEGSFTLGSGSVNEIDYYFYFVRTTIGYKRLKTRMNNTYLIETNNKTPQIVEVNKYYDDYKNFWKILFDGETKYYKIYVPKGTIVKQFKVN